MIILSHNTLGSISTLRSHWNNFTGHNHIENPSARTVALQTHLGRITANLNCEEMAAHPRKSQNLDTITTQRWLGIQKDSVVELYGFSDASQKAMAAVLYIKSTTLPSHSTSSILISKTKVAPPKRLSIPRLELGAAVLLTKLAKHVLDNSRLLISYIHLWIDAKVALTWISSHPVNSYELLDESCSHVSDSRQRARLTMNQNSLLISSARQNSSGSRKFKKFTSTQNSLC